MSKIGERVLTDSPFSYYDMVFDVPIVGATILDLGCGKTAAFGRSPANIGNTVISLSPALARQGNIDNLKSAWDDPVAVAARAQALPLRDESVDMVVSAHAVPFRIPRPQRLTSYQESIRVLRAGGVAQFFPYFPDQDDPILDLLTGVDVRVDEIDDPTIYRFGSHAVKSLYKLIAEDKKHRLTLVKHDPNQA